MGPNDIIELLKTLSEKTRAYEAAKTELNEVQKKLHGTPYLFSRSEFTNNGLDQKQCHTCPGPSRVKRGRGRPKKIKKDIKTTLDQDETGNGNQIAKNKNNNIENVNRIGDDTFPSCESYCLDMNDNREEEYRDCCEDDTRPDFKDAVYAFIEGNIYIETRYGNYYDINTLELRGWYNPYTGKQEGLL